MSEYYDDWGTGSTADGDMASNYTADTGGYDMGGYELPASTSGSGDPLFTYYTPQSTPDYGAPDDQYNSVASVAGSYQQGNSGVSSVLGDIFDTMTKPFNKENDPTGKKGAAAISIGGPAIFKMLSELMTGAEKKKMKQSQQVADAATLNATTNANAVNLKQQNLNASQISGTNFGAKPKGLLYQPANFTARQKRAGYQGA